jgi:hypothetical protein
MNWPQTRRSPAATGLRDRTSNVLSFHPSTAAQPIERLLQTYEHATGNKVHRIGRGFRIGCAACGTSSPKVAVNEADNGSVLLHAFCGHTPAEVLSALGLQLADLFPRRDLRSMTPAERSQLRQMTLLTRWRAALDVLCHETTVLLIAASRIGDGVPLDDTELTRMRVAALKVFDAQEVLHGR